MSKIKEFVMNPLFGCFICVMILVFAVVINNAADDKVESTMSLREKVGEITIQSSDNIREYGSIKTYTFDIIDTKTGEACSLSKGVLDTEDIENKLMEHLKNNNYKVKAISVVKDQFYIQQDTAVEAEDGTSIKMIRIKDGFTADDFFALTEAVYDSVEVSADSLIRHNLDGVDESHLYYIYTYTDKGANDINADITVPLNEGN